MSDTPVTFTVDQMSAILADRLAAVEDALLQPIHCAAYILAWDSGLGVLFEDRQPPRVTSVLYASEIMPTGAITSVPTVRNAHGRRAELVTRGDALAAERRNLLDLIETLTGTIRVGDKA